MNELAKVVLAVAVLLASREVAAQPFKCTDAAGKVTYSGVTCAELGLKDAGEVKERIQVTPAPPPSTARPSPAARSQSEQQPAATPPAAAAPETPERRCFTTRNAKGATVTRCNDKPDE
jgi:hypothetical protein